MITGNETITPQLKYRQEWEDRTDGDSLGLVNYTDGGITLKQHMVIEFTKTSNFEKLPHHIQATICEEDAPYMEVDDLEGGKERYPTYGEPYVQWLLRGKVKYAIMQANEVIKQLNEEV